MIAAGTIIVLVLAVLGWFQLRDRIADQGVQAADTCVEGTEVVSVTVDPDISSQVTQLAAAFDETGPVVRDHCIALEVTTRESSAVADGLRTGEDSWDTAALGDIPSLWIPQSSDWIVDVPTGTIDGTPRSVAGTPVVLATPPVVADALGAANVGWADLPRLQSSPDGLDSMGLPGWGGLRLRLPVGPESRATASALGAVAVATGGDQQSTPTPLSRSVAAAMASLAKTDRGSSSTTDDSTDNALAQLSGDASETAEYHAVPVTEQQLESSAQNGLIAYAPSGPTPIADHPAVILSGPWTDETSSRAAAQFVEFLREPLNAQLFVDSGFELQDAPAGLPGLGSDARSALLDAVLDPATPKRVTTLLDVSGSMDTTEGSGTRLSNTVSALDRQFDSVTASSEIGLWVFSKDLDGSRAFRTLVPTGPIDEATDSESRRDRLKSAADGVRPATATSTYESVTAAYIDALAGYSPGKPNSVLVITDGPNDDTSISSDDFLTVLRSTVSPARPVAIDVVSIGTNSDSSTLQSMSDITGGSFTTVASSDGAELPELLRKLLY